MDQLIRSFSAVVDDIDNSERSIVAKISVDSVDRYNSLIEPRGIDLKAYVNNPIVLFEHGKDVTRGSLPIGRNSWIKLNKQGTVLIAKTRFANDDFSSLLYDFYRDGTMTGWSVRLLEKEQGGPPTREEIRSRSDLATCGIVYRSTELTEYSCVACPGNAEALSCPELRSLSTLVIRGFWTPPDEIAPMIERMAESDGMESGGALVDDGDEEDDDANKKKKKKKRLDDGKESDDAGDKDEEDDPSDDGVKRSADESVMRFDENEPRDDRGRWTAAGGADDPSNKNERRKDHKFHDDAKSSGARARLAATDKLQATYDKNPLYTTTTLKDSKTGEKYDVNVVKNASYHGYEGEKKYIAQIVGEKSGVNDRHTFNDVKKAAAKADMLNKQLRKDGLKPAGQSRAILNAESVVRDMEAEFDGELESIAESMTEIERTIPEMESDDQIESTPEPVVEVIPDPIDPLAGLPPLVGRTIGEISIRRFAAIESWKQANENMIRDFAGWLRGEA